MSFPLVIECGDHQLAPYSFLCRCLIDNPSQTWVPMDVNDGREVEHDWLCQSCVEKYAEGDTLEETLVPICINCVRRIRGEE